MDIRCQQFTSQDIANEMLDFLGYQYDLYGKTLLENSCGEGNILCLAVERYIQDGIRQGYKSEEIVLGLERDIYGAEIVESTYKKCIENLNNIVKRFALGTVQWKVILGDILTRPFQGEFDYIIGNPPYISYRNLDKENREYIKKEYSTCSKGKPDYCYAFIENAIQYLSSNGSMVYLIPNSIYKNVYAQDLRDLILEYIEEIRDYPNQKLFNNAMTSSAIMLLKKMKYIPVLRYINVPKNENKKIEKINLVGKWIFDNIGNCQNNVRFGDYFRASMAIATQRNNIFVINDEKRRRYGIERGALRSAVSPRNQKYKNKEFIIFPYKTENNEVINYTEEEYCKKYPNTYAYLAENKEELEKRDADKSAKWFEFGRNQALKNMNKVKLLVSTIVTHQVNVYDVGNEDVPYAGIYIVSNGRYDIDVAKCILESDSFLQYIKGIGTPASGSSLRITANDINNYMCSVDEIECKNVGKENI